MSRNGSYANPQTLLGANKKRKSNLGLLGEFATHRLCANVLSQISASMMKPSPTESVQTPSPVTCVTKRTGHAIYHGCWVNQTCLEKGLKKHAFDQHSTRNTMRRHSNGSIPLRVLRVQMPYLTTCAAFTKVALRSTMYSTTQMKKKRSATNRPPNVL